MMGEPYGIQDLNVTNPYRDSLIVPAGLAGLFSLPTLLALWLIVGGRWGHPLVVPAFVGMGLFVIFSLSFLVLWLMGHSQVRRGRAFLASRRPLVRWTYTPGEWQEIKEDAWQEQQGDWWIQLGCLTFLFGLIGLLVGAMVGAEEGFLEAVMGGASGVLLGAIAGAVIGGVVAGGNYLAARRTYARHRPGQVALAPNEIYAYDRYFKANGYSRRILEASLEKGGPALLQIKVQVPPRPRMPTEEEWLVVVPPRLVEAVEALLPHLIQVQQRQATGDD